MPGDAFFFFALMYIYFSRTGPSWLHRGSLWLQSELLAARAGSVDPAQQLRPEGLGALRRVGLPSPGVELLSLALPGEFFSAGWRGSPEQWRVQQ